MSRVRSIAARRRGLVLCLAVGLAHTVASCSRESPGSSQSADSPVAARFNGTWVREGAELGLWAVNDQHLQVMFRGEHEYLSDTGPMANVGEADGWAPVDGDTAVFRPTGHEPDCTITIRAEAETLDVREQGDCGFGLNVTATGTYRRVSQDRPDFGPPVPSVPDGR